MLPRNHPRRIRIALDRPPCQGPAQSVRVGTMGSVCHSRSGCIGARLSCLAFRRASPERR